MELLKPSPEEHKELFLDPFDEGPFYPLEGLEVQVCRADDAPASVKHITLRMEDFTPYQ